MSKLILTRRPNESIVINDTQNNTRVTMLVLNVRQGQVKFNFGTGAATWLPVGGVHEFKGIDLKIEVLGVQGSQVRFGFEAPSYVNIVRTEIIGRARKPVSA